MNETNAPVSPVAQRDNPKLGVWVFLGGEVVFFGTLIVTYLMLRLHSPADFEAAKANLSIPLIGANTFILILSSYMVVRSLEAIRTGSAKAMRNFLLAVIVLGLLFVGGQAFEWITLHGQGVWFQSTFGTPFFTLTGIHGTHVFVGVIWAIILQFRIRSGAITQKNHLALETFGLYWHFVDVVWIVLFTLFYLI